jgi:uncharacterized protein (TIGR02611 family)
MGTEPDEDRPVVGLLNKIRANRTGHLLLKIGIALLGALVIALGLILIPFPGPGWAIVILGLAIWSLEFTWAKRVLDFTRRHVRAWTGWAARRSWPARTALGAAGVLLVAGIVWGTVRVSLGLDLIAEGREWLGDL